MRGAMPDNGIQTNAAMDRKSAAQPTFISRLRPLTILQLEMMSPAQRQRREALEAQERREWIDAQRKPARRA